jgi:hypothetical protein
VADGLKASESNKRHCADTRIKSELKRLKKDADKDAATGGVPQTKAVQPKQNQVQFGAASVSSNSSISSHSSADSAGPSSAASDTGDSSSGNDTSFTSTGSEASFIADQSCAGDGYNTYAECAAFMLNASRQPAIPVNPDDKHALDDMEMDNLLEFDTVRMYFGVC